MKKYYETAKKIRSIYVKDDYLQLMMAYRDYLILFGNKELMYYKNLSLQEQRTRNVYLDDERRKYFPYSQIPEHIERKAFLFKRNFANQILDFEKPYIKVNDGLISKITAFKDDNETIIHSEILNGKLNEKKVQIITRKELEHYLETGFLSQTDTKEYESISIFDGNGILYNSQIASEQYYLEEEKRKLSNFVDRYYDTNERTKKELQTAIATLNQIEPFYIITRRVMIKFRENNEIKLEKFLVRYLENDKYEITTAEIPLSVETLSTIKENCPVIKSGREPKISLFLNPTIPKELLQKEKTKILVK